MMESFEYDFLEFTRYRLLRQKPPIPLSSDILWNFVLLPLYGRGGVFEEGASVNYTDVLKEMQTQVRGYGLDNEDSLRGVINKSLKFLNELGWVEFKKQDEPVKVYPNKAKG